MPVAVELLDGSGWYRLAATFGGLLALVFAAKSLVRREDITSGDTTYYLAGTMVNFTYSVVFAQAVAAFVG